VQGVLWAEPAINNALFLRAMQKTGVPNLGAMLYDRRMHPGQQTLTPNQAGGLRQSTRSDQRGLFRHVDATRLRLWHRRSEQG
jgi:hypothetical protein